MVEILQTDLKMMVWTFVVVLFKQVRRSGQQNLYRVIGGGRRKPICLQASSRRRKRTPLSADRSVLHELPYWASVDSASCDRVLSYDTRNSCTVIATADRADDWRHPVLRKARETKGCLALTDAGPDWECLLD